jgi:two-component system NtrC family response regulator
VEAVLFGHEKGAYTGAETAKDGLIQQADGGTLFLDEVGELPLEIQKKFLRVLQERSFRPVGSKHEQKSDFRLIVATNKDLDELVKLGSFREDLLFRLRALTITLPLLKDRVEDIKPLALHYISKLCERYRIETKGFSPDFFDVLTSYDWPGNVRELNQSLERALTSAGPNPMLFPKDLPTAIRAKVVRKSVGDSEAPLSVDVAENGVDLSGPLPKLQDARAAALAVVEPKYLKELLSRTSGKIDQACRISGLSRSRLYTLLKKYDIPPTYPMIKASEKND